jgi:hypothetical protein
MAGKALRAEIEHCGWPVEMRFLSPLSVKSMQPYTDPFSFTICSADRRLTKAVWLENEPERSRL